MPTVGSPAGRVQAVAYSPATVKLGMKTAGRNASMRDSSHRIFFSTVSQ
jgi:hypothetical protein